MTDSGLSLDELPDGLVVADDTGTVVGINAPAERLLGRTTDECVGRDYREVIALVDASGRDWWRCTDPYGGLHTRTGQPERQLSLVKGGGEKERDLLVTARYVRDDEGRVIRLVIALRDARARARLERSAADLVSTVSHELRSPLTSVKGFTATLLAKWDRFGDDQKKVMLQTVNADADRVTRLLSDLLDVSRIDAGRLEIHKQVVDLAGLTRKLVDGRVASGEDAERFVVEAAALPEMWGDPDKLTQVLANLVENAVKYGAGRVTVRIEAHGDGAAVSVSDEGDGLPDGVAEKVFSKFWRRPGDRRRGTGLGLYITKGLVEAHGGTIVAGRAPSGGALFRFTVPAGEPSHLS